MKGALLPSCCTLIYRVQNIVPWKFLGRKILLFQLVSSYGNVFKSISHVMDTMELGTIKLNLYKLSLYDIEYIAIIEI